MFRACFCVLLGVFVPQVSRYPVTIDQYGLLIVAFFAVSCLLLPRLRRCDLLFVLLGGLAFCLSVSSLVDSRIDADIVGDSLLTNIRIIEFPQRNAISTSFVAVAPNDSRLNGRLRVSWFEPPVSLRLGDVWQMELRLKRPRGSRNPGGADYVAWTLRQKITATGYVVSGSRNVLLKSDTARGVNRLRQNFVARAERVLRNPDVASVVSAIAVGTRHAVSAEQWDRYARTGTSHLMAISGLHIGLAAIGTYLMALLILALCGYGNNSHHVGLIAALFVAVTYAYVSGFAVPARRAALMLAIATSVLLCRRKPNPFRILATSAVIIALADPVATMAPGFKLSFLAVCLLFWHAVRYVPPIRRGMSPKFSALRNLVGMQFVLFMGLLPITALIFDRFSLAAPLLNLVAIPLFSVFTVPLVLLSLALSTPFPNVADLALTGAGLSVVWLESMIRATAAYSDSAHSVPGFSGYAVLALFLPMLWVLLPRSWPGRQVAWIGVAVAVTWRPTYPSPGCADIHALDVGQGLAIVIKTQTRTLVYDTGPAYRGGGSAAQRILIPFLTSLGISHIDRLIVSHSDLDHAGGVRALQNSFEIGDILAGEPLASVDSPVSRCTAGFDWRWDGVRFAVLHPATGWSASGNNDSCVLLVEAGRNRALMTGDIESAAESILVQSRVLPSVEMVAVPHHGSRTSSTAAFVAALSPTWAVVSAGHDNRWGFPKADVVARWVGTGARVLGTANSGAISMRMCADSGISEPREYRKENLRLWHDNDH